MHKPIYLCDFFNNTKRTYMSEDIEHICGIFSIKYKTLPTFVQSDSFGLSGWRSVHAPIDVSFYENDVLLFTKQFKYLPAIVIHGDGLTKSNTFFTFNENLNLNIYNMNNQFIKTKIIGPDIFVDFKRVNDKYAIAESQEMCTYCPFTSLINLDIFFDIIQSDKKRVYDDSRVHVPLSCEACENSTLVAMVATEKGFIVMNKYCTPISYNFTEENLVLYDDVFNDVVNFYENSESIDFLNVLNCSDNTKQIINDKLNTEDQILISMDHLNDEQKNKIFNDITIAYTTNNNNLQQTLAIIKPDAVSAKYDDFIKLSIQKNGFTIKDSKNFTFDSESVDYLYEEHKNKDFFLKLKEFMMSGPSILLILEANNAIIQWRQLIGPADIKRAKKSYPYTLRAIYGDEQNNTRNACHGSDSIESAAREIAFFNSI